ncbi:MAG: hypothetical protein GY795_50060 [Desulfobacterales bacterium]|nr:hypothetical protein [Desulfobacterales bacterium]
MQTDLYYEKLKDAASAKGISVREDKFKLVFVFSDDCDEIYLDSDDSNIKRRIETDGESVFIEETINDFLTMDRARRRVIDAFERRIKELGGTIEKYNSYWSVETKGGIGGEAYLDYRLTEQISELGETDALRKKLRDSWTEVYLKKEELSRLLNSEGKPIEELQCKDDKEFSLEKGIKSILDSCMQGLQNAVDDGKISSDIKDNFSEKTAKVLPDIEKFSNELKDVFGDINADEEPFDFDEIDKLEEMFQQYQREMKLPTIDEFQFPDRERYNDFDIWALEQLTAIRNNLNFSFRMNEATYSESIDWYTEEKDWKNHAAKMLKKHPDLWITSIGAYILKFGNSEDMKNGLNGVKKWLDQGGYDFDCFVETISLFRNELPELNKYFETFDSNTEMICAFKSGIRGLEKVIRDCVLKPGEYPEDGLYILIHPQLSREDIGRMFNPAELQPIREACSNWAKTNSEDKLKGFHSDLLMASLKLEWPEIQDELSNNPLLNHIFWSFLVDAGTLKSETRKIFTSFRSHLLKGKEPNKQVYVKRIDSILKHVEEAGGINIFDEEDLLLWTVRPEHHQFIRPLYALRISQIIDKVPVKPLIENEKIAIAWSRLRKKEMKALKPEWINN